MCFPVTAAQRVVSCDCSPRMHFPPGYCGRVTLHPQKSLPKMLLIEDESQPLWGHLTRVQHEPGWHSRSSCCTPLLSVPLMHPFLREGFPALGPARAPPSKFSA